ncbi:hypothetical protein [Paenibacillus marinisediminis]
MDELIDFLTKNPFIIILIVSFLISMLSGKKKKKNPRMPSFGGDTSTSHTSHRDKETEQDEQHPSDQLESTHQPVYTTQMEQSKEQYYSDGDRSYKHVEGDPGWSSASRSSLSQAIKGMSNIEASALNAFASIAAGEIGGVKEGSMDVSAKEAQKGIVWAEIIGPPRAKRPYGKH